MSLRWSRCDGGMAASQDGSRVRHTREGPDGAAAGILMSSGRHRVSITIDTSERARGFCYVGVLAVDERTARWPLAPIDADLDAAEPLAFGFCPLNGHLHLCHNPSKWGARGRKITTDDLAGRAEGAVIVLFVDMDRRTLAFGVDGAVPIESHVQLPAVVCPWVLLAHAEDSVNISGYRGPALAAAAAPAEEWLRFALAAVLRDHERAAHAALDAEEMASSRFLSTLLREGLAAERVFELANSECVGAHSFTSGRRARLAADGVDTPLGQVRGRLVVAEPVGPAGGAPSGLPARPEHRADAESDHLDTAPRRDIRGALPAARARRAAGRAVAHTRPEGASRLHPALPAGRRARRRRRRRRGWSIGPRGRE